MDGLIAYALAKKYTDKVGQDIISAGFKVQVEDNRSILNRQGEEKVLYLLPKEYGSSQDGYDEFVYANNTWEWVGKTDVSLDYNELENKPQIVNYTPEQSEITNELKNIVSFYPFTSSVRNGKLSLRFDDTTVIKCHTSVNQIYSLNSLSEYIHNSFTHFHYAGDQQIAPFINPKNDILSLFDYRPNNWGWTQLLFWKDATTNKPKCAFRYTDYNNSMDRVQFKELGAQIVSGVVNTNGTITFTDSEGNSFTTSGESVIGADGFSPSATVQQTASGATITVTDKNGTTTANISNGQDGNDYVLTAQDKSDIADIVLSELPTTQGVQYGN